MLRTRSSSLRISSREGFWNSMRGPLCKWVMLIIVAAGGVQHNNGRSGSMKYRDLRDFLAQLERQGELKRIGVAVDPCLEMTEICDRTLKAGGPALLFENPAGHSIPVLGNLFGTPRRVALAMGQEDAAALREVGKLLAVLKEPEPPAGWRDLLSQWPV